jgi:hypothetical protein
VPVRKSKPIRFTASERRAYLRALKEVQERNEPRQHVYPRRSGKWAVRRSGASRASRLFEKKDDAVAYARRMAQKEGSVVYLHRNDGGVRRLYSYLQDSVAAGK